MSHFAHNIGLVSQFTLFGRLKKGNKPDFHEAADVETARRLYDYFFQQLRKAYKEERVKNGVFQAMMDVELKNDGPVGVDYRSDDAAVQLCSFCFRPLELSGAMLTRSDRSQLRSTPNCQRRKRSLKKVKSPKTTRRKMRGKAKGSRVMSLQCQQPCWNKESKKIGIDR